jgi:hypothetical protein
MCYFISRIIPVLYKMFAIHIVMATFWIFSTLNGPVLLWVLYHPEENQVVACALCLTRLTMWGGGGRSVAAWSVARLLVGVQHRSGDIRVRSAPRR